MSDARRVLFKEEGGGKESRERLLYSGVVLAGPGAIPLFFLEEDR